MKLDVGVSQDWGRRESMEDRYYVDSNFRSNNELLAGVYDGHGGESVVELVKQELHRRLILELNGSDEFLSSLVATYEGLAEESNKLGLDSGTCLANFILVDGQVYFANAGDVRILVVGLSVNQLTIDHHPNVPAESLRIKQMGGVINKECIISGHGYIAVSRAIGDLDYQHLGLIATPYTGQYSIKSSDLAIVVISDGIVERMTNKDVAKIVRIKKCWSAQEISKSLVLAATNSGSKDNLTALVVKLK